MGFWGLVFEVGVGGLEFGVRGLGFEVSSFGFRVRGSGCAVWDSSPKRESLGGLSVYFLS